MASYTVIIVPLRNHLNSLDALRFFLWVKKMKDLEREKDLLLMGLQALEEVRYRLCSHLEYINTTTKELQGNFRNEDIGKSPVSPTLLLAQIHRVNWTLRNLACDSRRPTNSN